MVYYRKQNHKNIIEFNNDLAKTTSPYSITLITHRLIYLIHPSQNHNFQPHETTNYPFIQFQTS